MGKTIGAFAAAAALLAGLLATTGCDDSDNTSDTDHDYFDPTGVFSGPASAVGQSDGKDVVLSDVQSVTLTNDTLILGTACSLVVIEGSEVGSLDSLGDDDDRDAVLRELASINGVAPGQTCAIATRDGENVSFTVTSSVITVWRSNDDAMMQVAIVGETSGAGSVTYNYTGYR